MIDHSAMTKALNDGDLSAEDASMVGRLGSCPGLVSLFANPIYRCFRGEGEESLLVFLPVTGAGVDRSYKRLAVAYSDRFKTLIRAK